MCSVEQAEAVRRYYAAFPALQKGQESPLQYYLPAPAWCRKPVTDNQAKMQCELTQTKDWNSRNKKHFTGKERRNSYNGQKRNKKRWNTYSKSFDSKDSLPEWVTYEGVWDMETQDPVKEFIRAIALDEGYGTCENTVTDDIRDATVKIVANETIVPDLDDGLDFDADWIIPLEYEPRPLSPTEEQLYAKFEAKFDSSIEALWSRDQNTPDDDYQDLPIDFHELLASPSDYMLANPNDEKSAPISFESLGVDEGPLPCERGVSVLPEQLQPLNLTDVEPVLLAPEPGSGPVELHSFAFYEGVELYEVLAAVAVTMRSFIALNHSRDTSGFVEVMPRRARPLPPAASPPAAPPPAAPPAAPPASPPASPPDREDLLTAARTHFRPIRREADADRPRYADGDTFDIRGDLDPVEERRSDSGGLYIGTVAERFLEYRAARTIDYGRLNLTAEQRCPDLEEPGLRLRFPMRQHDAAVQTELIAAADAWSCEECGHAAKKMRAGTDPVWGEAIACSVCAAPPATVPAAGADDLSREWEELLSDISAAHARYAAGEECARADRKRRHSAALRCAPACTHPHARFLPCCTLAVDRPLTR